MNSLDKYSPNEPAAERELMQRCVEGDRQAFASLYSHYAPLLYKAVYPLIPEHTPQRLAQFAMEPIVSGRIIFLGNSCLKDITDRNPSKVFILIGINDIGKDIPDVVIAENYRKIVMEIHDKCPGTTIYVQSVLPVNPRLPRFPQHYDKQEHILALNKILSAHAKEGNYTYVDIAHLFVDSDGRLDSQYTYEGLHLKPPAYVIWVDYLKKQGYL